MPKKAQTITEYLIVFGVIIVIALIVVALTGGIPGLGPGQSLASIFWQTSEIAIPFCIIRENITEDILNISVGNNLENSITLTSFTLDGFEIINSCSQVALAPKQIIKCHKSDIGDVCSADKRKYDLEVSVTYIDNELNETFTYTGEGHTLKGRCKV